MTNHYCVRVYPNGEAKHTVRDEAGLKSWLEHNRSDRPGNALFVDGRLADPKDTGGVRADRIAFVEGILLDELARGVHDLTRKDGIGQQVETFGGISHRYQGYRPELYRDRFRWPEPEAGPRIG